MSIFDTTSLTRMIDAMPRPASFLLDQFFPLLETSQAEEIGFDVRDGSRRIAPFVSPLVAGKIIESEGFRTERFRPAYLKLKGVLDSQRPLKRVMGETLGGSIPAVSRVELIVMDMLAEHVDLVTRRLEVMAAEILRTGRVTVSGEQYPTQVVDFGRHPEHSVTLAEAALWDSATADPAGDLSAWSLTVLKRAGQAPTTVVMDVDAWEAFSRNARVLAKLDTNNLRSGALTPATPAAVGGSLMGSLDGRAIVVHADWYLDPADGVEKPILPSGTVILGSSRLQGVRAFGAIRDHAAGFVAQPYFSKTWTDEDPSVRYLLTQSAPLLIPSLPNASLSATVL